MLQGLQRLLMLAFITLHGDVNTGIAQVIGDPNFSHSHHSQARIFEFETHNLRDLFTQCLRNSFRPVHRVAVSSSEFRVPSSQHEPTRNPKLETLNFITVPSRLPAR